MKLRLFLFLLFLIAIPAVPLYLLRDTQDNQIRRWRDASRTFLYDIGDLDRAEELNEQVLARLPESVTDRVVRALILEARGTEESLTQSLEAHEALVEEFGSRLLVLHLYRARILMALGRAGEARAVAWSVVDGFPYAATMELGRIAMALHETRAALDHFRRATEFAGGAFESVGAWVGLADAAQALQQTPVSTLTAVETETLQRQYVGALEKALQDLIDAESTLAHPRRLLWVTRIADRLAATESSMRTPFYNCFQRLEDLRVRDRHMSGLSFYSLVSGLLLLKAAEFEATLLEAASGENQASLFVAANHRLARALAAYSVKDARDLLAKVPEPEPETPPAPDDEDDRATKTSIVADYAEVLRDRKHYTEILMAVANGYLASSRFNILLSDDSELSLAARIADAVACDDADISATFRLVQGLARYRGGAAASTEWLESFFDGFSETETMRMALALATWSFDHLPSTDLAGRFLDLAQRSGKYSRELLGAQAILLSRMRERPQTAERAEKDLEQLIGSAAENSRDFKEHLRVVDLLTRVHGASRALQYLRGIEVVPADQLAYEATRDRLATIAEHSTPPDAERLRNALALRIRLLLHHPGALPTPDAPSIRESVIRLRDDPSGGDDAVDDVVGSLVRDAFPAASDDESKRFVRILRAFCRQEFAVVFADSEPLADGDSFQPVLSLIRGTSALRLGTGTGEEAITSEVQKAQREWLDRARAEFQRYPDYPPNRLELFRARLARVPVDRDIDAELLAELESAALGGELGPQGQWLLVLALQHRLNAQLAEVEFDAAAARATFVKLRRVLRSLLELDPGFLPAYEALAETYVFADGADDDLREVFEVDRERAINALRAAPALTLPMLRRLTQIMPASRPPQETLVYLEALALLEPSADVFIVLSEYYLKIAPPEFYLRLYAEDPAPPPQELAVREAEEELATIVRSVLGADGRKIRALVEFLRSSTSSGSIRGVVIEALAERFRSVPEQSAVRELALAQHFSRLREQAITSNVKHTYKQRMLEHYSRSREFFETLGQSPPILLLNNLAWHLLSEPDEDARRRGLEIARTAKQRALGPDRMPQVYDTYAWALYRNGELVDALREYRSLLEIQDAPSYRFRFAKVLSDSGWDHDALAELNRVLNLPHSFPEREEAKLLKHEVSSRISARDDEESDSDSGAEPKTSS